MNLKAKVYVENQKKDARSKLDARLAALKEKGADPAKIQADATVRKLKAEIRQADFRLASIAAQEKQNRDLAQAKIDKIAAEKAAKEAPPEEKKEAPAEKKEKKPKKEKGEKQAKGEGKGEGGKKEKGEGKKEKQPKKAEPPDAAAKDVKGE